jgi:hypothetical protein
VTFLKILYFSPFTFCGVTKSDGVEAAFSFRLAVGVGAADVGAGATGAGDGTVHATDCSGSSTGFVFEDAFPSSSTGMGPKPE